MVTGLTDHICPLLRRSQAEEKLVKRIFHPWPSLVNHANTKNVTCALSFKVQTCTRVYLSLSQRFSFPDRLDLLFPEPETDLSPIIFDAFQAQASWYESAIEKASAACIRLERTRTQVSSQAARSPVSPPVRSPLASPSMSRWDFKEPLSEESEEAFAEDLREMLKYRTYEQACGRRARQLLKRLEWLPISDGRRLAEEVHRKLTAQRERKGVERSQGSEGLPRQPVTLEEVEASLGVLASEFGYEADGVPSDPQIDGRGSADSESLEAQGTQLAMRVKDSFPDIFEAQEKRARLEPYPVAFLGAMIGEEQPVEQPEEFERDAFYLVRQDGGLAAETHRAGGLSTNNSFLDVSHSAASDVTPMPAQLLLPFAKESAKKSKDVSPEDELLRSVMAPPGWAHMPGHMAWLKSVKDVDTALRAEIEFLGASSRDDVSARLQELARLHSRQVATAGVDQMKQQFLQSAKVAAAAQKVREDTEAPKPPKPLQIQEVGRERSATLGSPKSPKKGDRSRPTSGRARAETPPNKPPAKAPGRRTSKDVSGSRPMTPAESTVAESVEETVAEGVKVTVPSRKLETLYILQLLKSRRLKLRLLHSVNVLHSVQKRLAEDFRRECRPEAEKAAEVQTEMRKLVDRFMKSESPVPSPPEWEDLPVAFRPGRSPGLNLDQGVTSSGHNTRTGGRNSSAVQQREGGETHRSDASRRYSAVSSGSDADEGDVGRRPVRRSEVERSKRPSNGQSSKLEAGSTGKGEQVDDDSSQGFKSSEWDDMFEFDPVVGCRVVKDGRGVRVVYSEALARFEDLMVEIQKIATGAIFKGMEQVEAVPADSAEDRR